MNRRKIAIIGLGYVGLPLAVAFAKKYEVIGFDASTDRTKELTYGRDRNAEVTEQELVNSNIDFSSDTSVLDKADVFIVAVPTPIHADNRPDLSNLYSASELIANALTAGNIVVFESTVYPGVTEDECLPILEQKSGLKVNEDFGLGYSPERINPGDKERSLVDIVKVTSGSNSEWAKVIDELYSSIIIAGTHLAPSIKVAEAAKVIENTQRDLNIALINQLAQLFTILDIDTNAVLAAAGTKWNFLQFKQGLVGGHCIGVDPYYLCHKAETVGYIPDIILAGRRLNDSMAVFIAQQIVKALTSSKIACHEAKILVLGLTFKEDCPDTRNTKVIDMVRELRNFSCNVSIYDPLADKESVQQKYGEQLLQTVEAQKYSALVLAVPHTKLLSEFDDIYALCNPDTLVYDLKGVLPMRYQALRL